jgi:hypothetical protein
MLLFVAKLAVFIRKSLKEKFEDTKLDNQQPLIKEEQTMQWTKGQTMIYKTLHIKLQIE